jgi:hypothetical protein
MMRPPASGQTFSFHPMTAWADHRADGNGEPLALVLRPGNAGSNTAADHIDTARLALAQLPRRLCRRVLARADTGGGTHEFLGWLTARSRRLPMTATGRSARAPGSPASPTSTGTGSPGTARR